jgi:hypothetical protein
MSSNKLYRVQVFVPRTEEFKKKDDVDDVGPTSQGNAPFYPPLVLNKQLGGLTEVGVHPLCNTYSDGR